jgi:phosphatidylserine/phosphatidylglycerophosphate/cardiolipin synthase-like enzyme
MVYEVASRFKDPDIVRKVEAIVKSFEKDSSLIRGSDILHKLKQEYHIATNPAILYDLIQSGVLIKQTPAQNIEDYLFKIDFIKSLSFFKTEILAAEVIQDYEKKNSTPNTLEIAFAATIPQKFNTSNFEFDEIYPTLIRIAAAAKHDLWIVNPFFDEYGAKYLLPSLIGAAKNEISIRILGREICGEPELDLILPIKCIATEFAKEGVSSYLEIRDFFQTDNNGNQIYALHTKMMIADENIAYIGSANLTKHSLRNNFEIGVILKGVGVKPLVELTTHVWDGASHVDLEKWKNV